MVFEINLIHEDEVAEIGQGVGIAFLEKNGGKKGRGRQGGAGIEKLWADEQG